MNFLYKIILIIIFTLFINEARANTLFDSLAPRIKVTTNKILKKYFIIVI